ncbi:MAG TPA: isomerizing glutamine--fructose-6-phosphate transaminase, partial [Nitrospirales bacterium]|nr:isomerizing glutamine--fructose-6-phosphate transaminase [Nitrospirales bacterium]
MCGIIGYVGGESATPILVAGLQQLEYRGYDSAGIAIHHNGELMIRRSVGKLTNLQAVLQNGSVPGNIGIGHTRWATHGRPSEQNAHPHRSGEIVLVHNGIIENFIDLRHRLELEGYRFESETDTEVIAHLLSSFTKKGHTLQEAVRLIAHDLHGSYAIAVMSLAEPGRIAVSRSGCPLVIGQNGKGAFLASDVTPLLAHIREVVFLEDGDVGILERSGIAIFDSNGNPKDLSPVIIDWDAEAAEKGGYPDFMMKEIHEQPQVIMDTLRGRFRYETGEADLPDLAMTDEELVNARRIWIVACGTSWHSGLVGKYLFEEMIRRPVQVDIG